MRKCSPAKTAMINHKLCDIAKENCKSKQENLLYEEAVTIRSETGAALPPTGVFRPERAVLRAGVCAAACGACGPIGQKLAGGICNEALSEMRRRACR